MREAWIPNELSTDGLPRSFWFYDDIMETIQNYVEPHTKEFAMLKNQYRLNYYQRFNLQRKILQTVGLEDTEGKLALRP